MYSVLFTLSRLHLKAFLDFRELFEDCSGEMAGEAVAYEFRCVEGLFSFVPDAELDDSFHDLGSSG